MSFALSDSREIATALEAMKELVVARGGFVHPALNIEERDGLLRVICRDARADGQTLLKIPHDLLVPVRGLRWVPRIRSLRLAASPTDLSSDQATMLDLFISIYNASGKLSWATGHPKIALPRAKGLAGAVRLLKPGFPIKAESLATVFLHNRTYTNEEVLAGKTCIMPLLDFFNHHVDGRKFTSVAGHLQIDAIRFSESGECFASYGGRRDPLDLALYYNYIDILSPYAASAPVAIDITGFGKLTIKGLFFPSNHKSNPPKVEFQDDGLAISHFVIDTRLPAQELAFLRLAMSASGKRRRIGAAAMEKAVAEAPRAILSANREKLAAFRDSLIQWPELAVGPLLIEAARHQLANLKKGLAA